MSHMLPNTHHFLRPSNDESWLRLCTPPGTTLCEFVQNGTLEECRRLGHQEKSWMDNLIETTSLPMDEFLSAAHSRPGRSRISVSSSLFP
ncbi:hypothetical protein DPMN_074687 [Dreissena polymorpha]|uniref:Uncharacterized protein n=1 Tax=Dreissena polymorpha TaxID=45954 RepID=A0A9D3YGR2_DREPO|nr:hypothetical protein DPMN_074687 [Dreissena polymorpha]